MFSALITKVDERGDRIKQKTQGLTYVANKAYHTCWAATNPTNLYRLASKPLTHPYLQMVLTLHLPDLP